MKALLLSLLSLLSPACAMTFPQGRCSQRRCDASPYALEAVPPACFRVASKACEDPSQFGCCKTLTGMLEKIVVPTADACAAAVVNVTVDGRRKGGGVYFSPSAPGSSAELRITALRLANGSGVGRLICVGLREPCPTWGSFCPQGRVAIVDPVAHRCCPTCPILPPPAAPPKKNCTDRACGGSPYTLRTAPAPAGSVCFRLGLKACGSGQRCCDGLTRALRSIVVHGVAACVGLGGNVTVDGQVTVDGRQKRVGFLRAAPDGRVDLFVGALRRNVSDAGTAICVTGLAATGCRTACDSAGCTFVARGGDPGCCPRCRVVAGR